MIQELEIALPAEEYSGTDIFRSKVARQQRMAISDIRHVEILKQSIDARKRPILYRFKVRIFSGNDVFQPMQPSVYQNVSNADPVVIIGAGPAGLFAALTALEQGLKPIILERGKEVSERKRDNALLLKTREVNPNSNWCFGEGGAGTFSDGKLYTRSSKRGNVQNILQKFVEHGADEKILYEAHPHIGTDKLPGIITNIRKTVVEHGGEYYFNTQVTDFEIKNGQIQAAIDQNGNKIEATAFILATGHSSRDIFELFYAKSWQLEAKPFAMGIRAEHPQELINQIQYHSKNYPEILPPAIYQLVCQVEKRGVFSFCMCPGGIIVPAATDKNEMVVNGMSNSKRNSPFANAGIAVSISEKDIPKEFLKYESLSLLRFQQSVERTMFDASEKKLLAPTQRMTDFVNKKKSRTLSESSYLGGCVSAELHDLLPKVISESLRKAFLQFDKKMRGYYTQEANLLAAESRTSSPVRIPRNEQYEYFLFNNLYPCGEGAGYAGGIVSAAMDGCNCITATAKKKAIK